MTAEISLIFFADASKIIKKDINGCNQSCFLLDAVKMQQKHFESDGWQIFCYDQKHKQTAKFIGFCNKWSKTKHHFLTTPKLVKELFENIVEKTLKNFGKKSEKRTIVGKVQKERQS
jgi:hypothetical protein